jgi:hypothetical protein
VVGVRERMADIVTEFGISASQWESCWIFGDLDQHAVAQANSGAVLEWLRVSRVQWPQTGSRVPPDVQRKNEESAEPDGTVFAPPALQANAMEWLAELLVTQPTALYTPITHMFADGNVAATKLFAELATVGTARAGALDIRLRMMAVATLVSTIHRATVAAPIPRQHWSRFFDQASASRPLGRTATTSLLYPTHDLCARVDMNRSPICRCPLLVAHHLNAATRKTLETWAPRPAERFHGSIHECNENEFLERLRPNMLHKANVPRLAATEQLLRNESMAWGDANVGNFERSLYVVAVSDSDLSWQIHPDQMGKVNKVLSARRDARIARERMEDMSSPIIPRACASDAVAIEIEDDASVHTKQKSLTHNVSRDTTMSRAPVLHRVPSLSEDGVYDLSSVPSSVDITPLDAKHALTQPVLSTPPSCSTVEPVHVPRKIETRTEGSSITLSELDDVCIALSAVVFNDNE